MPMPMLFVAHHNLEILNPIVAMVFIYMMHKFALGKRPSNVHFHEHTML
jgi:hypothetical protein